uniref:Cytochrome b5 heme-binding domain-containing protein n=1 Tax=Pseudonaja textilis TaxID=8673 RepID=A0A670XR56_PSETE
LIDFACLKLAEKVTNSSQSVLHLGQVVKCNSDREAWLVIHDCIYVLLEQAGRDATESFEVVGHSMDAKEMLKQYLIGEIHPDGHKPDTSKVPSFLQKMIPPAPANGACLRGFSVRFSYTWIFKWLN